MDPIAEPNLFNPVLFIEDGPSQKVLETTRFLYNDHGTGRQLDQSYGNPIVVEPTDPELDIGTRYFNIKQAPKWITPSIGGKPYEITLFDFGAEEVHYTPLPATRENARAFGITLVRDGDCVPFHYKDLVSSEYTYGKWAGYQSPYLGPGRSHDLLTINATDLEYHDFPHIFFSRGDVPLVISVARWRPYAGQITLADLWIKPGDAILLPPKLWPPAPHDATPEQKWRIVLDMHGNRNSALACRFEENKPSLLTTTILADAAMMVAPATRPHYHEEKHPTVHPKLPLLDE
jgi:hypothetical protein